MPTKTAVKSVKKTESIEIAKPKVAKDWVVPVLVGAIVVAAFAVGFLYGKVSVYEKLGLSGKEAADKLAPSQEKPVAESPLSVNNLKANAKKLKLDQKKFDACLDESKFAQKVKDQAAEGQELGVNGTPSFFINNKISFSGAYPLETFKAIIDFELSKGDWKKPPAALATMFDGKEENGEATIMTKPIELGKSFVRGQASAQVKIVEYSDFECPFCGKANATVEQLRKDYGDKISIEYRHFPLGFHANAQKAAEAAECAGEQSKFWEMHDLLFASGE